MRRVLAILVTVMAVGLATVLAACTDASGGPVAGTTAAQAVRATNSLALAMLARLDPGSNVVASPYSVESALAMVDEGASGQTAEQLDQALGAVASPQLLASSNRLLTASLRRAVTGYGSGGPQLSTANNLWVQSGRTLETAFQSALSKDFGATPQQADFSSDPSGAVQAINSWVSQQTHGLIPTLMSPADVTAATELVLANAVYLHADWQSQFDPTSTADGPFRTAGGTVSVPFMSHGDGSVSTYPYVSTARYRAIALPYAHSSLQFVAVMPPAGQISELARWLTITRLNALTSSLRSEGVDLSMPKFTLSTDTSLNGFLMGLGVTRAFSRASQLDRIVSGTPLAIQAVVHDAILKVAEKGTTAAAATGVSIAPTAVAAAPVRLVLNHPFLIFIRDAKTGAVLFAARMLDPASAG